MKVVFEQGKSASKLLKYIFFFNIIASEEVEGKCHPVNKLNDDISKLYLLRENPRYLVVHLLEQGRDTRAGHHARPSTNRLTHVPTPTNNEGKLLILHQGKAEKRTILL